MVVTWGLDAGCGDGGSPGCRLHLEMLVWSHFREQLESRLGDAWEGVVVWVGSGGLICFCGGWVVDGEVCGVLW